jgi:SAM-dependent methyltransferase
VKIRNLALLRCPFCGGDLDADAGAAARPGEIESGVLRCACGEVPVLGGIPIFKREGRLDLMRQSRDEPSSRGPEIAHLLDLIRSGRASEALALALLPPGRGIERLLRGVEVLPASWQGRARHSLEDAWARQARGEIGPLISPDAAAQTTARDAFDRYYSGARRSELHDHFFHRFAEPRHLTTLSLATLLWDDPGPGLDLACGFGHTLHVLTSRRPDRTWIGLDRNFFELYVARRWVAPGAEYICADADGSLPFASSIFSGILCADAFHYFLRKRACASEMRRVSMRDGTIVLARVGNALREPREGYELRPETYRELFPGAQVRVVCDGELLERYIDGQGPNLSRDADPAALVNEKWVSLIVCQDPRLFREHGPFAVWPHGLGRLALNPLYVPESGGRDGLRAFALRLPSKYFEEENGRCRSYMPDHVLLGDRLLADLGRGEGSSEADDLLRRSVVLGFPKRYL